MGLVTVLYVFVKVSLFLPQWVEVRAFSILIVFSALSFEVLICSLNVSLGSKVSPSILGLRIVGSRVLSSCSDSSSLYSAGSGVKSVVIVLLAYFQIGAGLYAVGRPVQKRNDEDGQIGTIQSLPLERGALFIMIHHHHHQYIDNQRRITFKLLHINRF